MFKKIMLPLDDHRTDLEDCAVNVALDQARKHGAEIIVLSVIPNFNSPWVASFFPDDAIDKASKEAAVALKRFVKEKLPGDLKIKPRVVIGSPADAIIEQASEMAVDLIIMPSHTHRLAQVFLGSCASRVVERAACTVMVVKACC